MVLKRLEELTAVELRTELKRAGIKGKYIKAQAIMRLTTHLIDISEDPLTFEFDPEMPIDEVQVDGNPDDYEVTNDVPEIMSSEPAGSTAASVSGLVNSISAGNSANMPPVTLPQSPTAFTNLQLRQRQSQQQRLHRLQRRLLTLSKIWDIFHQLPI